MAVLLALTIGAAASSCRRPSPAVPAEVEIDWPDAAPLEGTPADSGAAPAATDAQDVH